jgi:Ca2+-binding EF-hand superfamily protein
LNRSVIEAIHHDSYSPVNAFRSVLDPKVRTLHLQIILLLFQNLDLLDIIATEPDFTRFDTDMDGFVDGADVKEPLMASGLPQHLLAKIWALVDTARNGRLNLAQFTLL